MEQSIWLTKKDQEEKWNKEWEKEEEEKKREREELDKCKEERLKRKTHDKGATSKSTLGAASKKKVSPNNQTIHIISEEIPYSPHNIQINSVYVMFSTECSMNETIHISEYHPYNFQILSAHKKQTIRQYFF